MGAITATFTPIRAWRMGGANNKAILRVEGTLVVTSPGGGTAGDIPASLFGLAQFIGPQIFNNSANTTAFDGYPEAVGAASVMIGAMTSTGVANLPNDTYKAFVQGLSA